MNSGSAVPTDPVDSAKAQQVFDDVVEGVGCAGEADKLQCLRKAEYQVCQWLTHSAAVQPTIWSTVFIGFTDTVSF